MNYECPLLEIFGSSQNNRKWGVGCQAAFISTLQCCNVANWVVCGKSAFAAQNSQSGRHFLKSPMAANHPSFGL
tara:strand:+ start:440 stop:661 length:222 start_codon:yes stop_codon:yes gene_type:complete